ncbi:MAG: hypothetical protein A3C43_00425 [Candidatus Schekmanbacteria bacterium RIFCSPHIGHO2_02_FULL_38_11]|uniref:AAA+ ATPase domain-containing protein n=1 Tax=Candidatus Schekmanbacteria bacterium RIFCSPLOWO2_12_FULL_38_15 TaxID=1817883 RepID=A0A1F7SNA9_9BACT|nr:MAG: hypothetical protein A2043_03590 [Candidatus Schekmanbacteria bacterium GWA2_38_9]OGL48382.1 MAG: hypothetical protein A3H37_05260 [Candidatus Schekmanbacteria bacterium RIFCSPLOWO2_02_FULL_38_14]OGL51977.1 MAG: hypothetical protein A3C43_00425 [Candidatus Schekmanbacteria bacterium RIFCSPHIGHO2_02_FULL_38_11]OGL55265.1 MAG: hypothetical protein A3G31_04465 [Candidatus Schekmanbacteria bacterium RIFCSPLOWO2_12_FULL_38_15]
MKNILLAGQPGVGKTTTIKKILEYVKIFAGGFYTQEIRLGGGRIGFEIVTLKGEKAPLANRNVRSKHVVGDYGVILENIEKVAVKSLIDALKENKLIVIDEIGKMELFSEEFKKAVLSCLDSEKIVLATVTEAKIPFVNEILKRDDVDIFQITTKNRNQMSGDLRDMVWEMVKEGL